MITHISITQRQIPFWGSPMQAFSFFLVCFSSKLVYLFIIIMITFLLIIYISISLFYYKSHEHVLDV